MDSLLKYNEFINESLTPVMYLSVKNQVKNSIVKFLHEKGQATRKEILEFAATLGESGGVVDRRWISRNKPLIKCLVSEEGPNQYSLTKLGKRFAKSLILSETKGNQSI
jgi:hypothetical protein